MAITYTKNRAAIASSGIKLIQCKLSADSTWTDISLFTDASISVEEATQNLGGENSTAFTRARFEFLWIQSVHGTDDVDLDKFKNVNVDIRFQRKNLKGSSTTQVILFTTVRFSISLYAESADKFYYRVSGEKSVDTLASIHTTI